MIAILSVIALGFFLGMRHATDADHIIAVTTIVSGERRLWNAAMIGSLWGIGHTVTIFLAGGTIILFNVMVSRRIGLAMEFAAALMLILLGALNLTGVFRSVTATFTAAPGSSVHSHPHAHGDYIHSHPHGHGAETHGHGEGATPLGWFDRTFGCLGLYQVLRPLVVGVVHGLAGSAAVALLVLTTIQNPVWSIAYLLVFGIGTIAGMMLITVAIAVPFALTAGRFTRVDRQLATASGLLSLAFGLFLAYQIGVYGLWTPE